MDDLLNLPLLAVDRAIEDPGNYQFFASCEVAPRVCCGAPRLVKNGRKRVLFLDLPIKQKRVSIWVNRRRWFCKQCGRTVY